MNYKSLKGHYTSKTYVAHFVELCMLTSVVLSDSTCDLNFMWYMRLNVVKICCNPPCWNGMVWCHSFAFVANLRTMWISIARGGHHRLPIQSSKKNITSWTEWNIAIYCAQVERDQDSASRIVLQNNDIDAFWELACCSTCFWLCSLSGAEIGAFGAALAGSPFEERPCFKFIQ